MCRATKAVRNFQNKIYSYTVTERKEKRKWLLQVCHKENVSFLEMEMRIKVSYDGLQKFNIYIH